MMKVASFRQTERRPDRPTGGYTKFEPERSSERRAYFSLPVFPMGACRLKSPLERSASSWREKNPARMERSRIDLIPTSEASRFFLENNRLSREKERKDK